MADRVKYFLLGVLFLVVAGVIAYDRWNSAGGPRDVAEGPDADAKGTDVFTVGTRKNPDLAVPSGEEAPKRLGPPAAPKGEGAEDLEDPALDDWPVEPSSGPETRPTPARTTPQRQPEPQPRPRVEPKPVVPGEGWRANLEVAFSRAKDTRSSEIEKTHVVRKGETLEAIAIRYYGSRAGIDWIADANGLGNRNRIFANQKLVIPAGKELTKGVVKAKEKGTAKNAGAAAKVPSRYTVKAGDGNLYAICRRLYGSDGLGARVWRVMDLNHLHTADVKAGTVLLLPPR